jgi:hypothetical protein
MTMMAMQREMVDAIKRHAVAMSIRSPRAESYVLAEYLWAEEGTEQIALHRAIDRSAEPPPWLAKLISAQLADERRHAELLRGRFAQLGAEPPPAPALARAKLWWLERACKRYLDAFAAGPIVVLLAVAAQLEATGARVLGRHLGVMEARAAEHPTTLVLRAIVADERRHAKSCAAAAERLVRADEREAFDALRARVASIDRSFGITLAVRYWVLVAALAAADRIKR